jgi:hypothetical protein
MVQILAVYDTFEIFDWFKANIMGLVYLYYI